MKTRISGGAVVCAALMAVAGCGGNGGDDSAEEDNQAPSSDAAGGDEGWESAVVALRTAEGETDDGTVTSLERDEDCDAEPCWEVNVVEGTDRQFELRVSQDGQKVIESQPEDEVDDDAALAMEAAVSADEMAEMATDDYDGVVSGLEIDTLGDGTGVWEVTVDHDGSSTEYKFDAESGDPISSAPAED